VEAAYLEGGGCRNLHRFRASLRRLRATGALLQPRRLSSGATAVGDGGNYGGRCYGGWIYGGRIQVLPPSLLSLSSMGAESMSFHPPSLSNVKWRGLWCVVAWRGEVRRRRVEVWWWQWRQPRGDGGDCGSGSDVVVLKLISVAGWWWRSCCDGGGAPAAAGHGDGWWAHDCGICFLILLQQSLPRAT
jgi:hypothetical protein